jgi:predicted ester cyclase
MHKVGLIGVFYGAFPDLHHTFEDQAAEGDKVATRLTFRGAHNGDFQGIPPTGKAVAFGDTVIDRFWDGKLAEHWSMFDMMGLMQQLGVIPTPGQ